MFKFYSSRPPHVLAHNVSPYVKGWPYDGWVGFDIYEEPEVDIDPETDKRRVDTSKSYEHSVPLVMSPPPLNRKMEALKPENEKTFNPSALPLPGQIPRNSIGVFSGNFVIQGGWHGWNGGPVSGDSPLEPFLSPPMTFNEVMAWEHRLKELTIEFTFQITEGEPNEVDVFDEEEWTRPPLGDDPGIPNPNYMQKIGSYLENWGMNNFRIYPRNYSLEDTFTLRAGITSLWINNNATEYTIYNASDEMKGGIGNVGSPLDEFVYLYEQPTQWGDERAYEPDIDWSGYFILHTKNPSHRFLNGMPPVGEVWRLPMAEWDLTWAWFGANIAYQQENRGGSGEWAEPYAGLEREDEDTGEPVLVGNVSGMGGSFFSLNYWPVRDAGDGVDGWKIGMAQKRNKLGQKLYYSGSGGGEGEGEGEYAGYEATDETTDEFDPTTGRKNEEIYVESIAFQRESPDKGEPSDERWRLYIDLECGIVGSTFFGGPGDMTPDDVAFGSFGDNLDGATRVIPDTSYNRAVLEARNVELAELYKGRIKSLPPVDAEDEWKDYDGDPQELIDNNGFVKNTGQLAPDIPAYYDSDGNIINPDAPEYIEDPSAPWIYGPGSEELMQWEWVSFEVDFSGKKIPALYIHRYIAYHNDEFELTGKTTSWGENKPTPKVKITPGDFYVPGEEIQK
jgi:hypothetical protein